MAKKFSERAKSDNSREKDSDDIENLIDNLENLDTENTEKDSPPHENGQKSEDFVAGKVISTEEKLTEMQDKYLRLSAEFDNYRKRTLKERIDLIKSAGESVILKIIPVLDDFERAIGFIEGEDFVDESKQGIFLIYKKMKEILTQQGLKEIETLHKEFNTDIHEAVTKVPAPDNELKGKVVDVIEKGYMLGDKVVRYAKVVVGE